MSLVFPKWTNRIPTALAVGLTAGLGGVVWGTWYYATPDYMEVGYEPLQPVDYSHHIHAGKLGIDCRYCHTHVDESRHANIPDTNTCMNCHQGKDEEAYLNPDLWRAHKENKSLSRVRAAYASQEPIRWRRVHKLPDYAYFNHAVHVHAGVSCVSCHARVDQQAVVRQSEGMGMGWCLDCHRDPSAHLVQTDDLIATPAPRITDLAAIEAALKAADQAERGRQIISNKQLAPPENCGACHY